MYDIFFLGNEGKHWDTVKTRYPNAQRLEKNLTIDQIQQKSFTTMFWIVYDDLILNDFNLNSYTASSWDDQYTHVFKNGEYNDGVCLFNKKIKISKREFDNRFFSNKKDIEIIASTPVPYEIFNISSFEDYKLAAEQVNTSMFWAVFEDINIVENFKFNYQVPWFNQSITHVFQNGENFDGVCLFSKKNTVSQREFDYRFFNIKKEIPIQASTPKLFDIVFISYYEPFAENNFKKLLDKNLDNKIFRIKDVDGIHNAHKQAASLVNTKMFWVVDADAELLEDFKFNFPVKKYDQDTVHVWKSQNPVNGLEYGNGGVKLLPTKLTLDMRTDKPDMTTSISGKFKSIPIVSNINKFNTDPFNSWKSAFRECCKLASRIIDRQQDEETQYRLDVWCNESTDEYALDGARAGRDYGSENKNNLEALKMINDFTWLEEQFNERCRKD